MSPNKDIFPSIHKNNPHLSEEEIEEANARLERYLEIVIRVANRKINAQRKREEKDPLPGTTFA